MIRTPRQRDRGDAIPRPTPDMASAPWPGRGGGPGSLPGFGGSDGKAPRMASYALQPPTYFQPPGAPTLRLQGRQNAQTVADGMVELAAFELQGGELGVLRILNLAVVGLLNTSDIVFRVVVGGQTVQGWELRPFPAPVAVFQQEFPPESTLIELQEGVKIALTSEVVDGGTYDLDFMAQGWRYGRELRDDYQRAWRAGAG